MSKKKNIKTVGSSGSATGTTDLIAASAIMPEDLEFDRELERMGAQDALPPEISDREPVRDLTKEVERKELLSSVLSVMPANTDLELREQVHQAKQHGCDSVEATVELCERFCRDPQLRHVGYFLFQDIKVYIAGEHQRATARDKQTVEQRMFGVKPA
jgi:hypothetical protein